MTTFFPAPRIAISMLFLMNGFMVGSWSARIPDFAERLAITESGIGLAILAFGLGSMAIMPLNGILISRLGTFWMMMPQAIVLSFFFLVLTAAPTFTWALVVVFFSGGLIGGMDVAMNSNAVIVERSMRRAIMSSCHGFWSLGLGIGSLLGGFLVPSQGLWGHAFTITVISLIVVLAAWPLALKDKGQTKEEKARSGGKNVFFAFLPWLIGFIGLGAMFPEGAAIDWANLYFREGLGANAELASMAVTGFGFTMAFMRFLGDSVRDRLGAVKTFRYSALLAGLGYVLVAFAPTIPLAILGFALAGVGLANTVPICFSAAGNLKGFPPGAAIAVVTVLAYSGLLVVPPLIGFVSEQTGFAPIYFVLGFILFAVSASATLLKDADSISED